jgi:hypothetical protein
LVQLGWNITVRAKFDATMAYSLNLVEYALPRQDIGTAEVVNSPAARHGCDCDAHFILLYYQQRHMLQSQPFVLVQLI